MKKILIAISLTLFLIIGIVSAFAADANEYKTGDADLNGVVNIKDATLIQKHIASIQNISDEGLPLADTDANGVVNIKDATLVQKFIAGLVGAFPTPSQQPTEAPELPIQTIPTTPDTEEPTDPTTEPTDPTTEPTAPTTEPTTSATEPTTSATEPTTPTKPSVDSDGYYDVIIKP